MIEFRSVSKRFPDGTLAVDDFSLQGPPTGSRCSSVRAVPARPRCSG